MSFFKVHVNGDYECLNKYDGRGLSDTTFKTTLDKFLQPGNKVSLIDTLASKLIKLKTVLQTLDSYRFHTCSLLVTYDAGTWTLHLDIDTLCWREVFFAYFDHLTNGSFFCSRANSGRCSADRLRPLDSHGNSWDGRETTLSGSRQRLYRRTLKPTSHSTRPQDWLKTKRTPVNDLNVRTWLSSVEWVMVN